MRTHTTQATRYTSYLVFERRGTYVVVHILPTDVEQCVLAAMIRP